MKKLLLCMFFFVGCMAAQAQDVLVLRAGYEIEVQVQSMTETDIVYVPWDEPDGMSYSIPKTDVLSIRYADGRTEVLSTLGEGGRDAANQKSLEEQKREAAEAQRLLEEQKAKEAAEKARLELEEKARLEREKAAAEERVRLEKERAEKAEQERILKEQQAKERAAREKAEAEEKARIAKERAEQAEQERLAAQQRRAANREEIRQNKDWNRTRFQTYIHFGAEMLNDTEGGMRFSYDADISMGGRIKKYAYVGVEAGYHFMQNAVQYQVRSNQLSTHFWYVPVGIHVRGYIPAGKHAIAKRIYPYINATAGGYLGSGLLGEKADLATLNVVPFEETVPEWKDFTFGLYCQVGAGVDFNWFSIGAGYTWLIGNMNANQAYAKIGFRLGRVTDKQQSIQE